MEVVLNHQEGNITTVWWFRPLAEKHRGETLHKTNQERHQINCCTYIPKSLLLIPFTCNVISKAPQG